MAFVTRFKVSVNGMARGVNVALKRNIGATSIIHAKAAPVAGLDDPIQKLFLDKLNEYKQKSAKIKEGELVDSNPEIESRRSFEMDNLHRRYGGENMEEFPKFSFEK